MALSYGPLLRRNVTRDPSGETANDRGSPSVKRAVRARSRGKLSSEGAWWTSTICSVTHAILAASPDRGADPSVLPPSLGAMSAASPVELPDRRLLLVHAHPDDETISNGVTMARYVAEGAHVTLITCTLGEEGEVLVPDLAHLASHHDDSLGRQRIGELAQAMRELGVTDHRFLGGTGRYRDTGMVWSEDGQAAAVPPDPRDDTFWRADLREAADHLVPVLRQVRPQVVVAYDDFGQYGHPDHVQAHRVATYAIALAAAPSYRPDLGPGLGRAEGLLDFHAQVGNRARHRAGQGGRHRLLRHREPRRFPHGRA